MYAVASSKERMVNVRLEPDVHEDFKIACALRGASMSSLLHQYIYRVIREEKALSPQEFGRSDVQPATDHKVRHVRNLGELTDETKKKAGKR